MNGTRAVEDIRRLDGAVLCEGVGIGNLDGREAAELTATIGADVLIPMHNDLFAANHVTPAVLADFLDRTYPRQKYHWLQPGELYFYIRG